MQCRAISRAATWAGLIGLLLCQAVAAENPVTPAAPLTIPAVHLADVPAADLSPAGWSDPQVEGDIHFRTARAATTAPAASMRTFRVKAWWDKDAVRPKEGENVIAQIRYKDVAHRPIVFSVFSGLGKPDSMLQLHRFGGMTGDLPVRQAGGKWKTAEVPVTWDCVARLTDAWDMTAFGLTTDTDLPVAEISFRKAEPADVEKYNAETRKWVAFEQHRVTTSQPGSPALAPAPVPERLKLGRYDIGGGGNHIRIVVPFSWPAHTPMLPNTQPPDGKILGSVSVRMCENQIENGSFGACALNDAHEVTVKINQPKNDAGDLVADITVRTAEYSMAQRGKDETIWFPTRLWPAYPVDVPVGRSQWFVLDIRTTRGETKPGKYVGSIEIKSKEGDKSYLPLNVEVLPIDLLTMSEANLSMAGCWGELVSLHDVEFQIANNHNGGNPWAAGVRPPMKLVDGKLVIDFRWLDDWMIAAKKRGEYNEVWFLGGNPYGFPRTMTLQRELYKLVHPAKTDAEGDLAFLLAQNTEAARDKMLPEVRPLYVDWIRQVATHAREAGWPEIIVTPFDEPAKWVQQPGRTEGKPAPGIIGTGPWIKTYFEDCCAAIKEGDAKTRIYASIHNNRTEKNEGFIFLPVVDVFCCGYAYFNAPWMMAKVKATPGKEFWQYGGNDNQSPNSGRYFFGYFLSWQDARGTLCWAYNRTSGFDAFGGNNWAYAWATPFDVIPSPFFQAMRAGGDMRRIVETYKKKFANDPEAMALLTKTLDEAHEAGTTNGSEHVNLQPGNFWLRPGKADLLDQWRDRLLDKLAGAAAKP